MMPAFNDDLLVAVEQLKNGLVARATGDTSMLEEEYRRLRDLVLVEPVLKVRLPRFIQTCRTLGEFWGLIKGKFAHYQERRDFLGAEFGPVLDYLEGGRLDIGEVGLESDARSEDPVSHVFIHTQIVKCDTKLASGDFDGAITNARALLEAVLREMERRLGDQAPPTDGDLNKLYKRVQKLLNLDPGNKGLDTPLKQVLSGLASVVSGLSGLRNALSDAHARSTNPQEHHARLVVNASKTLTNFLFETFKYQQRTGRLLGGPERLANSLLVPGGEGE